MKKFQTIAFYLFPILYLKSKYIKLDAELILIDTVPITQPCPQSNFEKLAKMHTGNEVDYNKLCLQNEEQANKNSGQGQVNTNWVREPGPEPGAV